LRCPITFLEYSSLLKIGFKHIGVGVEISDKAVFYDAHEISIGDHSRIDDFSILSGRIELGRNVHIAVQCNLAGGEPGIKIEAFAGLAYGCQVFSQSDDYSGKSLTNPTVPDEFKNEVKSKISIGKHAILGTHTIVLPGVEIGEGCSFSARSLIMTNTSPWGFYAGSPVKRIKDRDKTCLSLEKEYINRFG
jgi:acetyltransferase-like isoleucine patch superfamily enzyme